MKADNEKAEVECGYDQHKGRALDDTTNIAAEDNLISLVEFPRERMRNFPLSCCGIKNMKRFDKLRLPIKKTPHYLYKRETETFITC